MKKIALLLTLAVAVPAAAIAAPVRAEAPQANIVQTAASTGQFTTLLALAKQAGLVGALSGSGKLTVFAPTDAAFKKVPKATLAKLGKDKALLKRVLLYHVVKGQVPAAKVVTASVCEDVGRPVRPDPSQRKDRLRRQGQGLEGRHQDDERDHPRDRLGAHPRLLASGLCASSAPSKIGVELGCGLRPSTPIPLS